MNEKRKVRDSADSARIDINEGRELRRWASELAVDENKLKQIVEHVGSSVGAVRNAVGR